MLVWCLNKYSTFDWDRNFAFDTHSAHFASHHVIFQTHDLVYFQLNFWSFVYASVIIVRSKRSLCGGGRWRLNDLLPRLFRPSVHHALPTPFFHKAWWTDGRKSRGRRSFGRHLPPPQTFTLSQLEMLRALLKFKALYCGFSLLDLNNSTVFYCPWMLWFAGPRSLIAILDPNFIEEWTWLAQLGERRSAERKVTGSNPGQTDT